MADPVAQWLERLGLGKYSQTFIDNEVDLDAARDLTEEDLKDLGLPLGPRKKILRAIPQIDEEVPLPATSAAGEIYTRREPQPSETERRHLTVMFCDLVGSTEHAASLDPEDMHALLTVFQETCGQIAAEYGGHIAKLLGDGLLIYFGYPKAQEDDAERAIRAALAVIEAVRNIRAVDQRQLQSRIGIASGVVVIGDILSGGGSDLAAVSGSVPHLAARLESAASPNSVLIAQSTRRLIGELFDLEQQDPIELKGFDKPVAAFAVRGAVEIESRFSVTRDIGTHTFVGRENELGILHDCWAAAKDAEGQAILVSGEAGIGKSRLLAEFCDAISEVAHIQLRYQCSPQHIDAPLHPIIMHLRRAAEITGNEEPSDQLLKIEDLIRRTTGDADKVAPLFAQLLGISAVQRDGSHRYSPEVFKELVFDALSALLEGLSSKQPVLVLFEDLHWADPITHELLSILIARSRESAVMILATTRPEQVPSWLDLTHTAQLNLRRLRRNGAKELVREIAGVKLHDHIIDQILSKADGNPLFVEEITKALVEGERLGLPGGASLDDPAELSSIPATLHDSLVARLDRLPEVKDLAQIAAVIGRTFQVEALAAASGRSIESVRTALYELEKAKIVYQLPGALKETFEFKHALIRDAAYDSLTRAARANYHFAVAVCLEEHFPDIAEMDPGLVARHFFLSGKPERSLEYWLRAGRAAYSRSALADAVQHLRRGLGILHEARSGSSHDELEIYFQSALGVTLTNHEGYAATATVEAYERAHALLSATEDVHLKEQVLAGLVNAYMNRADFRRALPMAREKLANAEASGDALLLSSAHRSLANLSNHAGKFAAGVKHGHKSFKYFDTQLHSGSHRRAPHHDGIGALGHYSTSLWHVGRVREANKRMLEAYDLGRSTGHPNTICYTHHWLGLIGNYIRRDIASLVDKAKEMSAVAIERRVPQYAAHAKCWMALESLINSEHDIGLSNLREARETLARKNVFMQLPYYSAIEAEILLRADDVDQAITCVRRGLSDAQRTGEVCYFSQFYRLLGKIYSEFLGERKEAQDFFVKAVRIAKDQGSKMFELRSTVSLAGVTHEPASQADVLERIAVLLSEIDAEDTAWDVQRAEACLTRSS